MFFVVDINISLISLLSIVLIVHVIIFLHFQTHNQGTGPSNSITNHKFRPVARRTADSTLPVPEVDGVLSSSLQQVHLKSILDRKVDRLSEMMKILAQTINIVNILTEKHWGSVY